MLIITISSFENIKSMTSQQNIVFASRNFTITPKCFRNLFCDCLQKNGSHLIIRELNAKYIHVNFNIL